jgi:hypothetical protein
MSGRSAKSLEINALIDYFMIFCNTRHSPNKLGSALTYAKSVTEKNNSRVDCAESDKKTVQAQRYEGWGFLAAGDCPAELPVINYQVKADCFLYRNSTIN